MTDKEIKDLAREFAYDKFPNVLDGEDEYFANDRDIASDDFMLAVRWLSQRYCIVSKDFIRAYMEASKVSPLDSIDLIEIFTDLFGEDLFTDKDEKQ